MTFTEQLQLALVGVRRNKLRSGLTAIGVTVGVFALTTIVAIGEGMEKTVVEQLTDNESNTRLMVRPGFGPEPEPEAPVEGTNDPAKADRIRKSIAKRKRGGPAQRRRMLLTPEALEELKRTPHVTLVRPLAIDRFKLRIGEHQLDGAMSYGVQPESAGWNQRVILGQPFREVAPDAHGVWLHEYLLYQWGYRSDAEQAALIGQVVTLTRPREGGGLQQLMATFLGGGGLAGGGGAPGGLPPEVGELVDPENQQALESLAKLYAQRMGARAQKDGEGADDWLAIDVPILGVVRERIESDGFEVWEDSFSMQADLYLPQAFAEKLFLQVPSNLSRGYNVVQVELDAPEQVKVVEKALKAKGYRSISIDTILERVGQTLVIVTTVVSGLTAVALLVAVLGIVNTMIMNVTERTREIGVLKALGATDGQVRGLFLVESGLIGVAGGVSGVALALLASIPGDWINRRAIHEATQYEFAGSVFHFPWWLIAIALGFAVVLSVAAALGPATRASRVDPVEALRDE